MSAVTTKKSDPESKENLPSAFALFAPSIAAFKTNMGVLIGLFFSPLIATIPLFVLALSFAVSISHTSRSTSATAGGGFIIALLFVYLAVIIITTIVSIAIIAATTKAAEGEKLGYLESLRMGLHHFWRFVGLGICTGALILLGLVLLIVPGLILMKRYFLAPYYLVNKNMGIAESMQQSAEDTKKYGGIWGLMGVLLLIELVSLIPFVGWVLTLGGILFYGCAPALRYLQIQKLVDHAAPVKK
ncbi:MAG TPA: hypothetical protein VLH38_03740 [Patescibacteria group bacterium]|nr:hypothetical protein [Patescibacteria group bacterium]